jgi:hypothetical protein
MSSKRFSMTVTLFILIALIMTVWLGEARSGASSWRCTAITDATL